MRFATGMFFMVERGTVMSLYKTLFMVGTGLILGIMGTLWLARGPVSTVWAANDRFEDYIMTTGAVLVNRRSPSDGVWLLDYRTGRLLGTVIDQSTGTITGWAELDLVQEFGIPPRNNVHFMMTTGSVNGFQSALYLAETVSGKFGVYTMGLRSDGQPGIAIRRQDITTFRAAGNGAAGQLPAAAPLAPLPPAAPAGN
ncbi:MAG: hypothetical protein EBS30_04280 [Planctomycetes bacterium]|nr:hypothetical protein [Planctomycetota bacterium]